MEGAVLISPNIVIRSLRLQWSKLHPGPRIPVCLPMLVHAQAHPAPAEYLVASWVALLSFPTQWGAQPQPPQPQTDGTAGACPTLDISLTGLQERERASPSVPTKRTKQREH